MDVIDRVGERVDECFSRCGLVSERVHVGERVRVDVIE